MKNKIPPLDEIRKEIDKIFQGLLLGELDGKGLYQLLMQKVKLLIAQEALERDKIKSQFKGYRNGYDPKKLKTPEGNLILST